MPEEPKLPPEIILISFIGIGIYFIIGGLFIPKWFVNLPMITAFSEVVGMRAIRVLSILLGSGIVLMLLPFVHS